MTNPDIFYTEQLTQEELHIEHLSRYNTKLSIARLVVFILAIAVFISLFEWSWPIALISGGLLLCVFLFLVKHHLRKEQQLDFMKRKARWYSDELRYQKFDFTGFDSGKEFEPQRHSYASDLDLFGRHSLFQYINRACTFFGKLKISEYLLSTADELEIKQRQQAVSELSEKHNFRLNLFCTLQGLNSDNLKQLKNWAQQDEEKVPVWLRWYRYVFLVCFWPALLAIPFVEFAPTVALNLFLLNVFFHFRFARYFMQKHNSVSKTAELLRQLTSSLNLIGGENFESELLMKLKADVAGQNNFSKKINRLSSYINYWDYRLNMIVYIIITSLFVWDVLWLLRVDRWKQKNRKLIRFAIEQLAELEALCSLGTLRFNHPEWTFPRVEHDNLPYFRNFGHPLIHPQQRVNNDFNFLSKKELVFVSGSNMAGKSTFLRSIGINLVLAQMGAPVCASQMQFKPVRIFSLMRIKDSIEENTSTFYFEIKRIKQLLETVGDNDNVLYLLDELLRGTNSHDKHFGTEALIKWLLPQNGSGFIASHDLGLAELEAKHPDFTNYHFDVKIDEDHMDFDYKLRHGPCNHFNASVLLREIGIEIEK